jgi:hypothetical protein
VQLAVTLESQPSDEARGEIARWWKRLKALEGEVEHLSPDEIHGRLLEIRAAILEILAPYGEALPMQSDVSGEPAGDGLEGHKSPSPGEKRSADTPLAAVLDGPAPNGAVAEVTPIEEGVDKAREPGVDEAAAPVAPVVDDESVVDESVVAEESLDEVNEALVDQGSEAGEESDDEARPEAVDRA